MCSGRKKFEEFKKSSCLYEEKRSSLCESNDKTKEGISSTSVNINNVSITIASSSDTEDLNTTNGSTTKLPFNNNDSNAENTRENSQRSDFDNEFYDEELCSLCNIAKITRSDTLDKTELNYLLKFVIHRIQAWVRVVTESGWPWNLRL